MRWNVRQWMLMCLVLLAFSVRSPARAAGSSSQDPWTSAQVVTPQAFAKQIKSGEAKKTQVVCVGFDFLYRGAHIPGAIYLGPARDSEGIERLKKWAEKVQKDEPVLLYCGCCPFAQCPNIRPAFKALQDLGFSNLKVLKIPQDFATDWAKAGFPTEKSN